MDNLHTVMRSIRGEHRAEQKSRRDHMTVFREFLDHLDRATRRKPPSRAARKAKARRKR
ncbi:MAG: hypothetical protein OJF62_003123 [Pseudolabrys sp.]|nr:hypothetical protein [Pseudolabrys sp.]